MVEVSGAYKLGIYEKLCLQSLRVMSNVKDFGATDGLPACRTNTTHYVDPYVTHSYMDGGKKNKQTKKNNLCLNSPSTNTYFPMTSSISWLRCSCPISTKGKLSMAPWLSGTLTMADSSCRRAMAGVLRSHPGL